MLSSIPLVGRLLARGPAPPSARLLTAVAVHHTETDPEKRARTLKYLLKGNHINHSLVQSSSQDLSSASTDSFSYNDVAYLLYAVYMMGGSTEVLNAAYSSSLPSRAEWVDSPAEIARIDWRDFFGQPIYQRAYVDFFEDVLAEHSVAYNWHTVVQQYLLGEGYDESDDVADDDDGTEAIAKRGIFLRHCLLGAAGAPILHLACAFELDSRQLAMEGLALASATYREDVAQLLTDLQGTAIFEANEELKGASLRAIFDAARHDSRFGAYRNSTSSEQPGFKTIGGSFKTSDAQLAFTKYWRAWDLAGTADLTPKLKEAQRVFAGLLVAPGKKQHSSSIATALSVSHGVRVLLPCIPAKYHLCILQQWWLLALAIYIEAGLPAVPEDAVDGAAAESKDWRYVNDKAIISNQPYMMVLHSLRTASQTWTDESDYYLAAAVRFVDDFGSWS
ncbi:hypothetical protein F503_03156 [Ophiostoma piceae UAMH 11346]|uniref:Uncharacterized protein n=1 Tax=Ophiostoma piceae (strain UAMH 11346) TaxID=1262450 RepID=S3BZP5_OPHP1|nr:hypothetical protein F503_03156 [Ophiostoma piceae UAMH 11346]